MGEAAEKQTNMLFEHHIKTEDVTFTYARGRSAKSGKEFHVFHEIILFMDGDAEFITESIRTKLSPGTLIIIPKETYHQLTIHGAKEDYCRCLINFYDSPALSALSKRFVQAPTVMQSDKNTDYLFDRLIKNVKSENSDLILGAVLVLLLSEINEKSSAYTNETSQNPFVINAVKYINENIRQKITVDQIARECMVSPSSLSHIFKKEMNTSLYKFIIKKRLINAYHRIMSGEAATTAAMECGFSDYSGFYKQYKKMFGISPSEKITGFNKQ